MCDHTNMCLHTREHAYIHMYVHHTLYNTYVCIYMHTHIFTYQRIFGLHTEAIQIFSDKRMEKVSVVTQWVLFSSDNEWNATMYIVTGESQQNNVE